MITRVSFYLVSGKREGAGGGNPVGNYPPSTGCPSRVVNSTAGYGAAPGGANMSPEDPAPDEEFALAITQKTQVPQISLFHPNTQGWIWRFSAPRLTDVCHLSRGMSSNILI